MANSDRLGVQAKAYVKKPLTPKLLDLEIDAAHAFQPRLQRYIVCCLNRRRPGLQQQASLATLHDPKNVELIWLPA